MTLLPVKHLCETLAPGDGAEVGPASSTRVLDYVVFIAKAIAELERKGESQVPERVSILERKPRIDTCSPRGPSGLSCSSGLRAMCVWEHGDQTKERTRKGPRTGLGKMEETCWMPVALGLGWRSFLRKWSCQDASWVRRG